MSNTKSAAVHRAPKSEFEFGFEFECVLCVVDQDDSHVVIDSAPVCIECVQTIIQKFKAAAQYKVNYPVEFSANLTLNPQDFAHFFKDFPAFLKKWTEREREYKTSAKDRVYCQGYSGFVGDRTKMLFQDRLVCDTCKS